MAWANRRNSPTVTACRAFYATSDGDAGQAIALAKALYAAYFVEDRDISSPEVVLDAAANAGIARSESR